MTPDQFRAARDALDLTPSQLAAEWGMVDEWGKTDNGERSIRRWADAQTGRHHTNWRTPQ